MSGSDTAAGWYKRFSFSETLCFKMQYHALEVSHKGEKKNKLKKWAWEGGVVDKN